MIDSENLPYTTADEKAVLAAAEQIVNEEAEHLSEHSNLGYLAVIASPMGETENNALDSMYTNIHGTEDDR